MTDSFDDDFDKDSNEENLENIINDKNKLFNGRSTYSSNG